jgi:hypothetical protein
MIQKSAPSKNGQRQKRAAGWDRKALIKNGKKKDKNKDHGRRPQTRRQMRTEEPGFKKCSGRAEKPTKSLHCHCRTDSIYGAAVLTS